MVWSFTCFNTRQSSLGSNSVLFFLMQFTDPWKSAGCPSVAAELNLWVSFSTSLITWKKLVAKRQLKENQSIILMLKSHAAFQIESKQVNLLRLIQERTFFILQELHHLRIVKLTHWVAEEKSASNKLARQRFKNRRKKQTEQAQWLNVGADSLLRLKWREWSWLSASFQ